MQLQPISYAESLSKKHFNDLYLRPKQPVIIRDFLKNSPALHKWNYDYFIKKAGNLKVAVHGPEMAHPDKVSSPPAGKISFSAYLHLIEEQPTESRLFLFNLLREKPEMRKDLQINLPVKRFLENYPLMFFGGAGSSVRYHYDIDMSHVFLSQFEGVKKILLFPNDQDRFLYRLPYSFHGIADLRKPDYKTFPALRLLKGWECTLHPGETLFIPSGYWHYIRYITQGYSVSHRALTASVFDQVKGFGNIVLMRKFDNSMRKLFKDKWFQYKTKIAHARAHTALQEQQTIITPETLLHSPVENMEQVF